MLGDDGECVGFVGIYRDLSAQRGTEEALRASERRYHSVVEALNEGVVMQDRGGHILAFNTSAEASSGSRRPSASPTPRTSRASR